MGKTLFFFLFLFFALQISAQSYVFGKIFSEDGMVLGGVVVMNMNTEEKTVSDKEGVFMLKAETGQELRFVKSRYERFSTLVSGNHLSSSLRIILKQTPELIEEVEIGFVPTGNLKKDVNRLETPRRVKELNENMASYMRTKPSQAYPELKTPSTLQTGPNYSAGQVNVLGLLSYLVKKTQKQPTTPNYSEQQAFYRRVKEEVNMQYFTKYGLDEYQFEELLVYADRKYELSKNFRSNFNIATIESYLRMSLKDFLNTRNMTKKVDSVKS